MSKLKGFKSLNARFNYDKLSNWGLQDKQYDDTMKDKINVRGKDKVIYADPLVRLREDKLRSMKRALYNSYQSAVIQFDKDDRQFHFRCLINHDKLKVDYEDKILSIPFREVPVEYQGNTQLPLEQRFVDTGTPGDFLDEAGLPVLDENGQVITQYRVKPGTTFKWISGNEGFMPDSYWIIFLQYSEQTAYFRGEIRKADDEIEIIPIDQDGNPGDPLLYHGWTVGPNEQQAVWNVKKNVVWNDMYYSKILYITKDQNTQAFFKRFNRVVINGQTWQIHAYNDNYGTTSRSSNGGMIRVALKETYTSTNQVIAEMEETYEEANQTIIGPQQVQSFDVVTYEVPNGTHEWEIDTSAPVRVLEKTSNKLKLEIGQVTKKVSFLLMYGDQIFEVFIKPFK